MDYIGGVAVRKLVVGNEERMNDMQILTTNEAPPSDPISFHHELAQTTNYPDHICFYCFVNDGEGGSTPIIRSDMVYDWLVENHPDFIQQVKDKGVKYVSFAPPEDELSSGFGRSWKSMYNVKTREEAEKEIAK